MRIWSLHPRHLDVQGLVALWRETLLAQKVLQGATRGYRHHPQLRRFQAASDPLGAVAAYLRPVAAEAAWRGYAFDTSKINSAPFEGQLPVTWGQLDYEWAHLRAKLAQRSPKLFLALSPALVPEPHPLFFVVPGPIEPWEVVAPPP